MISSALNMETTRKDVIICCIFCILAILVAPFIVRLFDRIFDRIFAGACNIWHRFLYKIAPEGSFRRDCAYIVLWITVLGTAGWIMRNEHLLEMSNEQLLVLLAIWLLTAVIFAALTKFLPDNIFKRICGWIFLAVLIVPSFWLLSRLRKGGPTYKRIWSRGITQGAGAAGAAAASAKKNGKSRRSKKTNR